MKKFLEGLLDGVLIAVCLCLLSMFFLPDCAGRQTAKFKHGYESVTKEENNSILH